MGQGRPASVAYGAVARRIAMFRGIANVSLDERGRFAMPARYRAPIVERCAGNLVLTIDAANACLLIYPKPDYLELEEKLTALAPRQQNRLLQRKIIGFATDVELDGNGRVLVPGELREYAAVEKRAILLGQINKLELWSESVWRQTMSEWRNESGQEDLEGLAEIQL